MEEVRSFQVHRPRSVYSAGSDSSSLGSISYRSYRRICIRIHDGPLIESLPQHLSLDHLGHGAKQDIRVYCCCCCCCCCEALSFFCSAANRSQCALPHVPATTSGNTRVASA
jgi:hypothetical protein